MARTEHVRGVTGVAATRVAARILNEARQQHLSASLLNDPFTHYSGAVRSLSAGCTTVAGRGGNRRDNHLSFDYVDGSREFQIC
jgi:hypothetical protein